MSGEFQTKHEENMVYDHITIMNNNKNRSESNTGRLNKHEERLDELTRVHSALSGIQENMKNISEKIDNMAVDSNLQAKRLELDEKKLKLDEKKSSELILALREVGKKTTKEKFEDASIPVALIIIIYIVLEAAKAGVVW